MRREQRPVPHREETRLDPGRPVRERPVLEREDVRGVAAGQARLEVGAAARAAANSPAARTARWRTPDVSSFLAGPVLVVGVPVVEVGKVRVAAHQVFGSVNCKVIEA